MVNPKPSSKKLYLFNCRTCQPFRWKPHSGSKIGVFWRCTNFPKHATRCANETHCRCGDIVVSTNTGTSSGASTAPSKYWNRSGLVDGRTPMPRVCVGVRAIVCVRDRGREWVRQIHGLWWSGWYRIVQSNVVAFWGDTATRYTALPVSIVCFGIVLPQPSPR